MLLGHEADGMKDLQPDAKPSLVVQLYQACANGDPVNAKRLIETEVDVKSKDVAGRTPLHLACGCKSAGAKEVRMGDKELVQTEGVCERAVVVQLLLDHGADASAVDAMGMTPMDVALKTQNSSIRKVASSK
eukprot:Skav205756  [mRNA]  locus=scaffold1714:81780:82330:- [translate_table: standard]